MADTYDLYVDRAVIGECLWFQKVST